MSATPVTFPPAETTTFSPLKPYSSKGTTSFCPVLIAGVPKTNVRDWHDFCNLLHCGDLLTDPARKLACLSDYRARSESVLETVIQDLRFVHGYNSFFNDVFIPIAQYDIPLFYERGVGDGTLRA